MATIVRVEVRDPCTPAGTLKCCFNTRACRPVLVVLVFWPFVWQSIRTPEDFALPMRKFSERLKHPLRQRHAAGIAVLRLGESTGTDDKKIAEEIRAKREAELLNESVYGRRATATFAQAALSYLEQGGSKRYLNKIIAHFGTTALTRVDQDAIDRGARKLYPDASASTRVRQFYVPVSAVMTHAAKRGWCSKLIIERPKTPPARSRWITLEEANRLVDACADHLRPLVTFLIYTGARAGEALWLDWRTVDLNRAGGSP